MATLALPPQLDSNAKRKSRAGSKYSPRVSSFLNSREQQSIRDFFGDKAVPLDSGIVQLLRASDSAWTLLHVGLVCYVRDYSIKKVSLRLLSLPGTTAPSILWEMELSIQFLTQKDHQQLLVFEGEGSQQGQVFGLNFHSVDEATSFHNTVHQQHQIRKSRKDTARQRNNETSPKSEQPLCLPVALAEPKKTERRDVFGTIRSKFGGKKKQKERPSIGLPTNFRHNVHVDPTNTTETEMSELMEHVMSNLNINPKDAREVEFVREAIKRNPNEFRASMRLKKKKKDLPPPDPSPLKEAAPPPPPTKPTSLDVNPFGEARNSLKVTRDNYNKRMSPSAVKSLDTQKKADRDAPYLRVFSHEPQSPRRFGTAGSSLGSSPSSSQQSVQSTAEEPRPPPPRRDASIRPLPSRDLRTPEVSAPPPPPAPPLPPSFSVSSPPPPAPPPPPSSSSSNLPSVTPDRQNLLTEIQNADKSRLKKVSRDEETPPKTPTSAPSILDTLQQQLEIMRSKVGDSDEESDTASNSEWSD